MNRAARAAVLTACLLLVAAAADAQTATRRPRQSWTADRRDFAIGDVVTIVVDEYTLASANKGNSASDRRSRDLGVGVSQSVSASIPSVSADVGTFSDAESRSRGEATRQNRFQGEMTVRVTGVEPSGLLRIEGTKVISVDDHREELTLTGFLRPEDISPQNLVDSWRVGDAELVYTSEGGLAEPKSGILGRILGKIWP